MGSVDYEYTQVVLQSLLGLPGYVDDVARRMISLARIEGGNKTIECQYGAIVLHASPTSTVEDIRFHYEHQCLQRRRRSLRLRAVC